MSKHGKKYRSSLEEFQRLNLYGIDEALGLVKKTARAKFDETVECHIKLGIDPKKSDQTVRGTVVLPHGTGKTPKVIVFAKGDRAKDAEAAGADAVGAEDLVARVKEGWSDFEICVATPDMMGMIGKELGRILGPRMPNPKVAPSPPMSARPSKRSSRVRSSTVPTSWVSSTRRWARCRSPRTSSIRISTPCSML